MRILAATVLWVAGLTACAKPAPDEVWQLVYGASPALRDGTPANDYIANDANVVPAGLKRCGVRFLERNGMMTDGAEGAFFVASASDEAAFACIQKAFPQTSVMRPPREQLEARNLTAG